MSTYPMTMNPKYLKYCKYYKGEEEAPNDKSYDKYIRFWHAEMEYYTYIYDSKHEYWETKGQEYLNDSLELKNFVSKIKDKTIRGFVAWATTMIVYNSPMDDCRFFLNYRYFDTPNKQNKITEDIQEPSDISECCIYYSGEDECPFNQRSIQNTFWRIEKIWHTIVRRDEIEQSNKVSEFLADFPDAIESISSVPTSLKATLYNQYCRFGGDKSGFKDYLNTYLSKAH